ncbi:glycoside hydrolase superfamily [Syncephalis fuscata]|nr:glycoside hydrolase superfamily [Syncephalis fuscata]
MFKLKLLVTGLLLLATMAGINAANVSLRPRPSVKTAKATCSPQLVFYWGQNSYGANNEKDTANWEKRLAYYCRTKQISNIVISFMHIFGRVPSEFDLSSHCDASKRIPGTKLLDCPELREDIKICQGLGVKIELGLGGATGNYGFANDAQAVKFAEELYNIAFAGKGKARPFGPGSLDGVNLDIETAKTTSYPAFVRRLRELQGKQGLLVTAAPQCPYPDAALHDTLVNSEVDAVYVQFYNNYCGMQAYGTKNFNFDTWAEWSSKVAKKRGAKVYLGIPGSPKSAGSGYASAARVNEVVKKLASAYPSVFGGVMMWDVSTAYMNKDGGSNFANAVHNSLKAVCGKTQAAPVETSIVSDQSDVCPAVGASCTEGAYSCANENVSICINGHWTHQPCGSGTVCQHTADYTSVFCDVPNALQASCTKNATTKTANLIDISLKANADVSAALSLVYQQANATHLTVRVAARAESSNTANTAFRNEWTFRAQAPVGVQLVATSRGRIVSRGEANNDNNVISIVSEAAKEPASSMLVAFELVLKRSESEAATNNRSTVSLSNDKIVALAPTNLNSAAWLHVLSNAQ